MRKRLKKKLGLPWNNKYNILLETKGLNKRISRKIGRKDSTFAIRYRFLPIGERDYRALNEDEITPDYPFASHWVISLTCWDNKFLRINAFPCSEDGSSPERSPVRIIGLGNVSEFDNALEKFEEIVDDIKKDRFWGN